MNLALIQDSTTIFLGIIIEAVPFILLGVIASSILGVFVKQETLMRLIPKNRLGSAVVGSMIGFIFPVCECGNIPVARTLMKKGAPLHFAISFLLAAPVFNPIVILATLAAFRGQPEVLFLRVGLTLTVAILVSLLFSFVKKPEEFVRMETLTNPAKSHSHTAENSKIKRTFDQMIQEFFEMSGVLIFGALLASFFQIIFPREAVTAIGKGPISSVVAMTLLAAIVSICSNVDAFFALGYTNTFTSGSILAFLVFGPMIDIKALFMLRTVFKFKTIFLITLFSLQLVFLATLFMNLNIS